MIIRFPKVELKSCIASKLSQKTKPKTNFHHKMFIFANQQPTAIAPTAEEEKE